MNPEPRDWLGLALQVLMILCVFGMFGCGYYVSKTPRMPVVSDGKLVFGDVSQVLSAYCLRCHRGDDPAGGYDFSTYASVMAGDPKRLCDRATEGSMPPRGAKPSTGEVKIICDWVVQGAVEK